MSVFARLSARIRRCSGNCFAACARAVERRAGKHGTFRIGASGNFRSQNDLRPLLENPTALKHGRRDKEARRSAPLVRSHAVWTRCSSKVLLMFNSGGKVCCGTKNQFIDMLALMERT